MYVCLCVWVRLQMCAPVSVCVHVRMRVSVCTGVSAHLCECVSACVLRVSFVRVRWVIGAQDQNCGGDGT